MNEKKGLVLSMTVVVVIVVGAIAVAGYEAARYLWETPERREGAMGLAICLAFIGALVYIIHWVVDRLYGN